MKLIGLFLLLTTAIACASSATHRETPRSAPTKATGKKAPTIANRKAPAPKGQHTAAAPAVAPEPEGIRKAAEDEAKGDLVSALREYLNLSVSAPTPGQQELYKMKALDTVETRLDEGGLRSVANDSEFGFLRGHALYRLGQISMERRDTDAARKYYSSVVSFLPGTDLAFEADSALAQLESIKFVEPKTIGVVLPLSGKSAPVGQRALRAIEMGLGLNDSNSNFKLAIMDSEGNPDTARRGVERLVREDNVIAIIGSLLSKEAPAVAAKAGELSIPVIGLSQRAGLTEAGPSVFRNALTGEMQVRELVRTSMDDLNMRRFAILAPNDAYGVEYANAFWDEVLARGGKITAAQFYDPKSTDFRNVCERLVGTWYIEGREDEYKLLVKERNSESSKKKKSSRKESDNDDVLPPLVDFDAVFIPDGSKMMGTLAAFLSYAGARNVKLLGTNLWNVPGVAKKAGLFGEHLVFVDSWQPDADDAKAPRFVGEYKKIFGESPTLIEIQAYDSALVLRSLISQGATSRDELTSKLTALKNFPGLLGPLDMSSNREVRRPLITYTTASGGNPQPVSKKR